MWNPETLSKALCLTEGRTADVVNERAITFSTSESSVPFVVVFNGAYISVEAKLFDEKEIEESLSTPLSKINELLLKTQDYLDLSYFTIREIDGVKTYFILGKLSSLSSLDVIEIEISELIQSLEAVLELTLKL